MEEEFLQGNEELKHTHDSSLNHISQKGSKENDLNEDHDDHDVIDVKDLETTLSRLNMNEIDIDNGRNCIIASNDNSVESGSRGTATIGTMTYEAGMENSVKSYFNDGIDLEHIWNALTCRGFVAEESIGDDLSTVVSHEQSVKTTKSLLNKIDKSSCTQQNSIGTSSKGSTSQLVSITTDETKPVTNCTSSMIPKFQESKHENALGLNIFDKICVTPGNSENKDLIIACKEKLLL